MLKVLAEIKKSVFCFSAFQVKLAAVENGHHQDQAKLNQQIQQLQKENASIQDEKVKLTRKMEKLEKQYQQGLFC